MASAPAPTRRTRRTLIVAVITPAKPKRMTLEESGIWGAGPG